jgi:hypothetical protein
VLLLASKGVTDELWGAGSVSSIFDHFVHAYCTLTDCKVSTWMKVMLSMLVIGGMLVHVVVPQCYMYVWPGSYIKAVHDAYSILTGTTTGPFNSRSGH